MNFDYAAGQIGAALKMAFNQAGWAGALDRSVDGVFRSFWAIAFAAPFALLGYFSLRRAAERIPEFPATQLVEAPVAFAVGVQVVGFLVDWAASLAALIVAARMLGAERRIADVIVGFNWTQVIVAATQTAPIAALSIPAGRQLAGVLFLPAMAFVIALYWGVLRRSLHTGVGATIGLIILLTFLGLIANSLVGGLAGVVLQAFS